MQSEWSHPYCDTFNSGFSPQTKIAPEQVDRLTILWSCELGPSVQGSDGGNAPRVGVQTTPLVMGGLVYVCAGDGIVQAIDAEGGAKRWFFDTTANSSGGRALVHTLNHRDGVVYVMAADTTVFGLDAKDGTMVRKVPRVGEKVPGSKGRYAGRAAPSFYREAGVVGTSTQGSSEEGEASGRGFVASYDLRSGKLLWRWYSVPPAKRGPKKWHVGAERGNISPYRGDWGTTPDVGGGGVWGTIAVDEENGRVYCGTGNSDLFVHADLKMPGPNLYTDCVVCLDAKTGKMVWYHQATPHDLLGWDIGWNTMIADVEADGAKRRAVICGSKNNHVYVLDAKTGKPLYAPVRIGHNKATLNAAKDSDADMSSNLTPGIYSPGHLGGINAPLAFAYNTIYVATQRVDQEATYHDVVLGRRRVKAIRLENTKSPQNSTLYAIDAGRGEVRWTCFMADTFQSASITVTAGMVIAIDRGGVMHLLDAKTGRELRSIELGGYGRAGASLGTTASGAVRLFVPVSGRDGAPNKLLCFGVV